MGRWKMEYEKLNKILYFLLMLIGFAGTYSIRNEIHIFWIITDIVSWIMIGTVPWILPYVRKRHEKRV
jgi:hypothetical protein